MLKLIVEFAIFYINDQRKLQWQVSNIPSNGFTINFLTFPIKIVSDMEHKAN